MKAYAEMNTQTHILIGWLAAHRLYGASAKPRHRAGLWVAAIMAAIIPDAWMIVMILFESGAGTSMNAIWTEAYFRDPWTTVDAIFNSIPIYGALLLVGYFTRQPWLIVFGLSAVLHALFDLPVHASDAHPHFWPISGWTFNSPFSYWEPGKGALVILSAECLFGLLGGWWMWRVLPYWPWRLVSGALVIITLAFAMLAASWAVMGPPWVAS